MDRHNVDACPAFVIISLDRRGVIRQQAAATRAEALTKATEFVACRVGVTVKDDKGRVIFESH